jgi:hypothetical protein
MSDFLKAILILGLILTIALNTIVYVLDPTPINLIVVCCVILISFIAFVFYID